MHPITTIWPVAAAEIMLSIAAMAASAVQLA